MAEFQLEDAGKVHSHVNGHVPTTRAAPAVSVTDERSVLGAYVVELDGYYAQMNSFESMEPDEVMQKIGAMVARLTEIRARLHRLGTTRAAHLRTKEIDPLLDGLRLLFQVHSRLLASRQFDYEVTRG